MKRIITKSICISIALFISFGIALNIVSCQRNVEEQKAEKRSENDKDKKMRIEQVIEKMVRRYNAITDWRNKPSRFTAQIEEALVKTDHRPILFRASLHDVRRQGDTYYADFHRESSPDIYFILECTNRQAKELIKSGKVMYAVVARITSVKKAQFAIKAGSERELYIEPAEDIVIANGRCLDFVVTYSRLPGL